MKKVLVLLMGSFMVLSACGQGDDKVTAAKTQSDYVFISMDGSDEHFIKANEGVQNKAKELGVVVDFQAPVTKSDLDGQARLVEDAIARNVKGIILAALDPNALVPAVEKAAAANIPVVYLDSGTTSDSFIAYAATDNEVAAGAAATEIARLLNGKGKVAIVHPVAGIATITARENGFKKVLAEYPDIQIVAELYGQGGDPAVAMNQGQDTITRHPDINAFFASNTEANEGLLRALEERMRTNPNSSKIYLVGFDFSQNIAKGVQTGTIDATVIQNPKRMGELSIQALVDYANGKKTEPRQIDTGYILVTAENVAEHMSESELQN